MIKEWRIKEDNSGEKSLVKRLLFSRGIKTEQEIYDFLHPLETKVLPPEVFSDMEKTVKRLSSAIDNNEKIIELTVGLHHGLYDLRSRCDCLCGQAG